MATNNMLNTSLVGQSGTGTFAGTNQPVFSEARGDNFINGESITATSATTTVLTVSSNYIQVFTGSTTQDVQMPVVTTLPQIGFGFLILNKSSGAVTAISSAGNTIVVIPGGSWAFVLCNALTGTTAASWDYALNNPQPSALTWNAVAGTTQACSVNNGYITNNAAQTTYTAPASAAVGDIIIIKGVGAGGWIMTANTGQTIRLGTAVTSSAGTVTSQNGFDSLKMTCIVANTTWSIDYDVSAGLSFA